MQVVWKVRNCELESMPEEKRSVLSFLEFSLCSSRACPGKMFVFMYINGAKGPVLLTECLHQRHVAVGKEFGVLHPTLPKEKRRLPFLVSNIIASLSRACLGKMITFSSCCGSGIKETVFAHLDIARLRQTVIAALVLKTCPLFLNLSYLGMFFVPSLSWQMFGVSYTSYYKMEAQKRGFLFPPGRSGSRRC
jgi:hypothetical protein